MTTLAKQFAFDIARLCGWQGEMINASQSDNSGRDVNNIFSECLLNKNRYSKFGRRQLNEILIMCNERIVSNDFFLFLSNGKDSISFQEFNHAVERFRKLAMLQYGSFRFAFKYLRNKNNINSYFGNWLTKPRILITKYHNRQEAFRKIDSIKEKDLPLLGYLIPQDVEESRLTRIRLLGKKNFDTYLSYDFLDVYVATSMRESWEYSDVNKLCRKVFGSPRLKPLRIRYFDPTQNYNENSIAKSLIEGLMLKRAKCTLYLVQETDTMGKDSEMASTLAQGKPVIAFVPQIKIIKRKKELQQLSLHNLLEKSELLRRYIAPIDATEFDTLKRVFEKISSNSQLDLLKQKKALIKTKQRFEKFIGLIAKYEAEFYEKRAQTLMFKQPLRFQINLESGVANGVLVARTPRQCSELIYRVLTNTLKFDIVEPGSKPSKKQGDLDKLNYLLVERLSGCAFRVITKDEMLTNSFWNFYRTGVD